MFNLTPNNKDEFEILHKELINHLNKNDQIFRSFKGLINGTYTQKMKMLQQEFIHYNGSSVSHQQLAKAKSNLLPAHKHRQEIVTVSPDQYILDAELGVIASINNK